MALIGGTNVPEQYVSYVNQAAAATGLPAAVVAAQINEESGFQPGVSSSAGAEGIAQFLPSTFAAYGHGSPFNAGDAFAAYANYMKALLQQFHGNIQDALAAYNAGPGNIQAGMGYADTILSNARVSTSAKSGTGTGGTVQGIQGNVPGVSASGATPSGAVSAPEALTGGTGAPEAAAPGVIGLAERIPVVGPLIAVIEIPLHALATVIEYSIAVFEPGQGQRLVFILAAVVLLYLSYRVLASSGAVPQVRLPKAV